MEADVTAITTADLPAVREVRGPADSAVRDRQVLAASEAANAAAVSAEVASAEAAEAVLAAEVSEAAAVAAALAKAASAAADAEKTHFIAKNRTSQEVLFFQFSMFLPRKAATVWASLHSVSPARRP